MNAIIRFLAIRFLIQHWKKIDINEQLTTNLPIWLRRTWSFSMKPTKADRSISTGWPDRSYKAMTKWKKFDLRKLLGGCFSKWARPTPNLPIQKVRKHVKYHHCYWNIEQPWQFVEGQGHDTFVLPTRSKAIRFSIVARQVTIFSEKGPKYAISQKSLPQPFPFLKIEPSQKTKDQLPL